MMTYKNTKVTEHRDERLCEKYYEVKHASGLSVFVFPKQRQSFCAILSCEYGSADNEFADNNGNMIKVPDGVAHFLEHKMFENDDGTSVEDTFSKLGADPNAFTKWDGTAYYYTCSNKENFYLCLDELIRFVMTPCFTEESVQKEQGIIAQEILMCEDDPYDRCFLNLVGGLYVKNPVRIDIAGTVKSISKIDSKLLFSCHDRFYTPANMALVICGDIELDRVLESVDRGFPTDKYFDSEKPIKKIPLEKVGSNKKRVTCNMAVERSMFCLGFKDSGASDDPIERRRRQIIAEILNGVIFSS